MFISKLQFSLCWCILFLVNIYLSPWVQGYVCVFTCKQIILDKQSFTVEINITGKYLWWGDILSECIQKYEALPNVAGILYILKCLLTQFNRFCRGDTIFVNSILCYIFLWKIKGNSDDFKRNVNLRIAFIFKLPESLIYSMC